MKPRLFIPKRTLVVFLSFILVAPISSQRENAYEKGQTEMLMEIAISIHPCEKDENEWKITRAIGYDHKSP